MDGREQQSGVTRTSGAGEPAAGAAFDRVQAVTSRIGGATRPPRDADQKVTVDDALAALALLRQLRTELESWEPRLIAAARERGASWAELAPALGVASRQAAERRYLRLRPATEEVPRQTRDDRVLAERDRRAGDRAAAGWARDNGADLRQLAGQITALTDLGPAARTSLDRLHDALGNTDPNALVRPLSDARQHLRTDHPGLAARVDAMHEHLHDIRRRTQERRTSSRE
ncbi:hypothetical protein ACN27G_13695 [Plantactinospora sp. WMMB334]|uniref:hypothetical protein n=1 Tax=Plantactinospora sp. WMMB334 TaxID=3404119 RepID=UPI003B923D1A